MKSLLCLAVAFMTVAIPAWADTHCNAPYAPEFRPSASMTQEELRTMREDTQAFIAASDIYQACLLKAQAKDSLNPGLLAQTKKKIEANQHEKERIAKIFNEFLAGPNRPQRVELKTSDSSH